jgi:hypothetical protein
VPLPYAKMSDIVTCFSGSTLYHIETLQQVNLLEILRLPPWREGVALLGVTTYVSGGSSLVLNTDPFVLLFCLECPASCVLVFLLSGAF